MQEGTEFLWCHTVSAIYLYCTHCYEAVTALLQAPLLDANVLDQLCFSDELWAKLDVPDVDRGILVPRSIVVFIAFQEL